MQTCILKVHSVRASVRALTFVCTIYICGGVSPHSPGHRHALARKIQHCNQTWAQPLGRQMPARRPTQRREKGTRARVGPLLGVMPGARMRARCTVRKRTYAAQLPVRRAPTRASAPRPRMPVATCKTRLCNLHTRLRSRSEWRWMPRPQ